MRAAEGRCANPMPASATLMLRFRDSCAANKMCFWIPFVMNLTVSKHSAKTRLVWHNLPWERTELFLLKYGCRISYDWHLKLLS